VVFKIKELVMKCPFCSYNETKVIDSRPTEEGNSIRRRRKCPQCEKRFTTYEKIEMIPVIVTKKSGEYSVYNRDKIIGGLIKACEKRPVSLEQIENIADKIEKKIEAEGMKEVSTTWIGEEVMSELVELDQVAYVRFASVYREFKDLDTFMDELEKLLQKERGNSLHGA
jgi:transcriptional repressor NrdR